MKRTQHKEPKPFYKEKFCKAVTGYTDDELRDAVRTGFVIPTDKKINLSIGRDMPREASEEVVDKYEIFMSSQFRVPLLDMPLEDLYTAFGKFRDWERHVHPNGYVFGEKIEGHIHPYRNYFDPLYLEIEKANKRGDEAEVKKGIVKLVDMILHD